MSQPVATLKKYKNRRIYDGRSSSYVTIDEVRDMFLAGESIRIVDGTNNDDLTAQVLMQLLHQDAAAARVLPVDLLQKALVATRDNRTIAFKEHVQDALRADGLLDAPLPEPEPALSNGLDKERVKETGNEFAIPPTTASGVDPLSGSVAKPD